MTPLVAVLFVVGYPTAIALIARIRRTIRERRLREFVVHQCAVAAIVAGWALLGEPLGVALNGAWFAVATLWWLRVR